MTFARKAFLKHCKAFKDENVQGCEKYEHGTQLSLTLSGRQETAGPGVWPLPPGIQDPCFALGNPTQGALGQGLGPRGTHLPSGPCSRH